MALVTNTGSFAKVKSYIVALEGFSGVSGNTSHFGSGDEINCTNVEYLSLELPEKSDNETQEVHTNLRDIKESVETQAWEDWGGMSVYNDEDGVNSKAFIAAQECGSTGTVHIKVINPTSGSTSTYGKWKAKVSKSGGGGGDANNLHTSFTPTFTLIESLAVGGAST